MTNVPFQKKFSRKAVPYENIADTIDKYTTPTTAYNIHETFLS